MSARVPFIAQALADLMVAGEHHYRRGVGLHAFDVEGAIRLAAAYLDEEGSDFRYRYAVLCGGEPAKRVLRTAALDPGDSDEPGTSRRIEMAGIDECEDFLYRLPLYLGDVTKSWETRSAELDQARARVGEGRRDIRRAERRRIDSQQAISSEGSAMRWTSDELFQMLGRYEQECIAAGMRPNAVHSYWDYARRFLDWRTGEYRPRGATGPSRTALSVRYRFPISPKMPRHTRETSRRPAAANRRSTRTTGTRCSSSAGWAVTSSLARASPAPDNNGFAKCRVSCSTGCSRSSRRHSGDASTRDRRPTGSGDPDVSNVGPDGGSCGPSIVTSPMAWNYPT